MQNEIFKFTFEIKEQCRCQIVSRKLQCRFSERNKFVNANDEMNLADNSNRFNQNTKPISRILKKIYSTYGSFASCSRGKQIESMVQKEKKLVHSRARNRI